MKNNPHNIMKLSTGIKGVVLFLLIVLPAALFFTSCAAASRQEAADTDQDLSTEHSSGNEEDSTSAAGAAGRYSSDTPLKDFGSVRIMTASDMHYLSPKLTDYGEYFTQVTENADGKTTRYSDELMEAFADTVISEKPDILVLSGDLTFNGARQSHEDLAVKLHKIEDAGIPVLVLSGNHDLDNNNAASFEGDTYKPVDSVSAAEFEDIYQDFGFSEALSKDKDTYSYVYEVKPGLRILMLDVNGTQTPCQVPETTLDWIEGELKDAADEGCRVISFSHQNLLQHSMFISGYVIDNNRDVLELFDRYNVSVNFTGHLHIQSINEQDSFTEIATSALSISPEHYGMIEMDSGTLEYSTGSVDVSKWAEENGSDNKDLLDFADYSRNFFMDTSRRQALEELSEIKDEDQRAEMADYFARRNYEYFAGEAFEEGPDDEKILSEWAEMNSFTGSYLQAVDTGSREDQNHLAINMDQ